MVSAARKIGPWDVRYLNGMFGKHGIWNAHKKAYERSALRSSYGALLGAWIVAVLVAVIAFFLKP
jgi:hypothetical protein